MARRRRRPWRRGSRPQSGPCAGPVDGPAADGHLHAPGGPTHEASCLFGARLLPSRRLGMHPVVVVVGLAWRACSGDHASVHCLGSVGDGRRRVSRRQGCGPWRSSRAHRARQGRREDRRQARPQGTQADRDPDPRKMGRTTRERGVSASTGEAVTATMRDDPMRKALIQIQGVFAELDKSLLVRKLRKGRAGDAPSEARRHRRHSAPVSSGRGRG